MIDERANGNYFHFINSDYSQKTDLEIQEDCQLQEKVDSIFKNNRYSQIQRLNTFLTEHPSFILSPYDQIRKEIIEDKDDLFTNDSLFHRVKAAGLDEDEEKVTACYDLCYLKNNPNIYRTALTAVSVEEYILNFLWINLNPQNREEDTAGNIFSDESIQKTFIDKLSKWADLHPRAKIYLWYDKALTIIKSQEKTSEMLEAISKTSGASLELRDIRLLPTVKEEIEHSLHPGTPVYYRVDLCKALIADYMMSSPSERAKYCVVSDIDVKPVDSKELFDQRTLNFLSSNGYVFLKNRTTPYENTFFIFNKENKDLQKVHEKTILQRTAFVITKLRNGGLIENFPSSEKTEGDPNFISNLDSQFIYYLYRWFFGEMGEEPGSPDLKIPRKLLQCPESNFCKSYDFQKSDPRTEEFRLVGNSNIPHTKNGRNLHAKKFSPIKALANWQAKPSNQAAHLDSRIFLNLFSSPLKLIVSLAWNETTSALDGPEGPEGQNQELLSFG